MKTILGVLLFLPLACAAQIYKCVEGGKTVFQQAPCANNSGAMVAPPRQQQNFQQQSPQQQPAQNPEARQLTALVAEALSRHDYSKAESLAVTAEHWNMISDERAREAQQKSEARNQALQRQQQNRSYSTNCQMIFGQWNCTTR
jgi:hypothetical protein